MLSDSVEATTAITVEGDDTRPLCFARRSMSTPRDQAAIDGIIYLVKYWAELLRNFS